MNVGFIGTGNMGFGMANNVLKAGYKLTVHDIVRERAIPLLEAGADWADNPKLVAEASDVTFTSLPGPKEMEAVALGENGVLEGSKPGSVFIDMTSNSPTVVRRICQVFAEAGVDMLDAPVSGGVKGARSGRLAVMTGGDEEVYNRVKPVLDAIGNNVVYCGAIGSGSICKLMHNCVSITTTQLLSEVFTLGVKAGVELKPLWETIRRGSFGNANRIHQLPESWFSGEFEPDLEKGYFAIGLSRKDVGLATELGREYNVPMPLSNVAEQELMVAMERGWGDAPSGKIHLLQEERAGVEVRGDFPMGKTQLIIEE